MYTSSEIVHIKKKGDVQMSDWNEQGAPNNNLSASTIETSKLIGKSNKQEHEFSEELSDGGERNEIIQRQKTKASTSSKKNKGR